MTTTERVQSLPLTEFRDSASETLDRIKQTGEPEVLTVDGEARAVILSPMAYSELLRDALLTRDVAAMRRALKEYDEGKGRPVGEMSKEMRAKLMAMKAAQEAGAAK